MLQLYTGIERQRHYGCYRQDQASVLNRQGSKGQ